MLQWHLRIHNITSQEYYNKFKLKKGEGDCKHCGKPTKYRGYWLGYSLFCSKKCVALFPETKKKILKNKEAK